MNTRRNFLVLLEFTYEPGCLVGSGAGAQALTFVAVDGEEDNTVEQIIDHLNEASEGKGEWSVHSLVAVGEWLP